MIILYLPCGCQVWDGITMVQCVQHETVRTWAC